MSDTPEMVERVTEAIRNNCIGYEREYRTAAITAIKAMRRPTLEMLEAGEEVRRDTASAEATWNAMIDAAIGGKEQA